MKVVIEVECPSWMRKAASVALPVLAIGVAGVAFGVPKTFMKNETLTAADLNASFDDLGQRVAAASPPGTVIAYAGPVGGAMTPPAGWLLCDGSAVSRAQYAALFATIGNTAGAGDGTTTFNVPDYRGRFLRGVDQSAGRDPDAGSRSAMTTGGATGDTVSTLEPEAFKSHAHGGQTGGTHTQAGWTNAARDYSGGGGPTCAGFAYATVTGCGDFFDDHAHDIAAEGGSETRPKNASVNYLIKY